MTINQQAFKEAEKELQKDRINEIKGIMKSLLQEIQNQKEIKAKAEESLRLLKLDMDNLREGKIEQIKERHEKSKKARDISPIQEKVINDLMYHSTNAINLVTLTGLNTTTLPLNFQDATSGTYQVNCSNGTVKELNF